MTSETREPASPPPADAPAPAPTGARSRLPGLTRERAQTFGIPLLVGALTLILGWRSAAGAPQLGLDPSWNAALHLAAEQGKDFGTEMVFTFGPLGFLKLPTWWGDTTFVLAMLYDVLTRLVLLAAGYALTRDSFGRVGAALLMLVLSAEVIDPAVPLAFAGAVWLLVGRGSDRGRLVVLGALGLLTGIEALAKANTGVLVLVLVAIALVFGTAGRERLRLAGTYAGVALVTGLIGWFATGQSLEALPDFVRNVLRVVSGYSAAMSSEDPTLVWHYTAALAAFVVGAAALWMLADVDARARRVGLLVAWTAFSWLMFKQGFVRHDSHALQYFTALFVALAVVPWPKGTRAFALVAMLVPLLALVAASGQRLDVIVAPKDRFEQAKRDLHPLLSSGERDKRVVETRARLQQESGIPASQIALLRGRTVHVAPWETSIVAAFGLRWEPLPVFQDYQAYTSGLDALNADKLRSSSAPERILLGADGAIDGRVAAWDPPAQARALLCRYEPLERARPNARFIVLGVVPDRCGPERLVGSVRAGWDEDVAVPRPSGRDRMLMVRIAGSDVGGTERLRNLLFKAHERTVVLNGTEPRRFISATAGGGLLLSAPASVELPGQFRMAPNPQVLRLRRAGGRPDGRPLRFDFYEIAVTR